LLIHGRKFDIRIWVLLTSELNVYIFKEGYIRTASEKYDISDEKLHDKIIHLTNNAI
jgi:hypothetical protein